MALPSLPLVPSIKTSLLRQMIFRALLQYLRLIPKNSKMQKVWHSSNIAWGTSEGRVEITELVKNWPRRHLLLWDVQEHRDLVVLL